MSANPPAPDAAAARLAELARGLERVGGGTDPGAGATLYRLARLGMPAPLAVAVHCAGGRAALWLAAACADRGAGRVLAVDAWPAAVGLGGYGLGSDPLVVLRGHAAALGVGAVLDTERAEPLGLGMRWQHGATIGLLHLQGGDDYAQRVREFEAWSRFVVPGGVVVIDGFLHQAAATRLVAELPRWFVWEGALPGKWVVRKLAA